MHFRGPVFKPSAHALAGHMSYAAISFLLPAGNFTGLIFQSSTRTQSCFFSFLKVPVYIREAGDYYRILKCDMKEKCDNQ